VATYDTHYLKSEDAEAHDILLAVQTGNKIFEEDRLTLSADDFSFCSTEHMEELFYDFLKQLKTLDSSPMLVMLSWNSGKRYFLILKCHSAKHRNHI